MPLPKYPVWDPRLRDWTPPIEGVYGIEYLFPDGTHTYVTDVSRGLIQGATALGDVVWEHRPSRPYKQATVCVFLWGQWLDVGWAFNNA